MESKTITFDNTGAETHNFPEFWGQLMEVISAYYGTNILFQFHNTEKCWIDNKHFSFSFIVEDIKIANLLHSLDDVNKEIGYFVSPIKDTAFVIITLTYNAGVPETFTTEEILNLFKEQCSHKPYLNDSKYGPHKEWLAKVDQVIKKYDTK